MKYCLEYCNKFFEFISVVALITSYILFAIQAYNNYSFINNKTKDIIVEKLLYEHFSEEIYSNIKSYPFSKIIKTKEYDDNFNYINIEVKLDTYFDCQGIKKGLLNEKICQDKIINNFTCCKSECCTRIINISGDDEFICTNYTFNLKKSYLDNKTFVYNDEELQDDPRRRYCRYFNLYSGNTSKIYDDYLQIENFKYNYEELLVNNESDNSIHLGKESPEGYIDCGEIDSLKNHLYVLNISCPINYLTKNETNINFYSLPSSHLHIFIRNFLSEILPSIHEWRNELFIEKENNIITIKDINKVVNENNDYYKREDAYFYINELNDYYDIYKDKINQFQKIYWYSSNYVGFKDYNELKKFKLLFKEDNPKDNPLYKIRNEIYPSLVSFVIGILLIILCLLYIFFFYFFYKCNNIVLFYVKDIIVFITFIIGFLLYMTFTQKKYEKINIDIDIHYKEILNLYNRRITQKFFLSGIIIIGFVTLFEIYYLFFLKGLTKEEQIKDKGSENSSDRILDKNKKNIHIEKRIYNRTKDETVRQSLKNH